MRRSLVLFSLLGICCVGARAAEPGTDSRAAALAAMRTATTFMTEKVAVHGGYVWSYLPDLSRRWGEMEARPQMIWVQSPGTIQMGHVFLDAYHATGDEFYYRAAGQVAGALIEGQLACGGWHYLIDFAGEKDLRDWYATVGKNAWRLEEYQHYYGNATFDDSSSSDATEFLLRFYLEKRDARAKASLDRAIQFVLDAQYPNGGWPQRFPKTDEFHHSGLPDYTGYITFNDDVTGGNVDLLIECYQALGDRRLLEPIRRGMDIFLATQGAAPQAGWSLQHTPDLAPAGARTYEPKSFATHTTASNLRALLKFYRLTGDPKYLKRIPETLAWLDSVKLPADVRPPNGGTHPTFVEVGTNLPLYIHRRGSNVINGHYYADHDWHDTIGHYSSFRRVDVAALRDDYAAAKALAPADATKESPLLHPDPKGVFPRYFARAGMSGAFPGRGRFAGNQADRVRQVIAGLNRDGAWITEIRSTSHSFTRDGSPEVTPGDFRRTQVGDETDTSPYASPVPMPGISTATFIRNLNVLISFVAGDKAEAAAGN
jgi:PelA/Pel-15E family pectate lyase